MANLLCSVLAVFALPFLSEGAKIMVVFPFPSKSHDILGEAICKTLVKAGHEITYVTAFPKKQTPNMRYIDIHKNLDVMEANNKVNLKAIINKDNSVNNDFTKFFSTLVNLSKSTFSNEDMIKMLNDPNEKFDLVLIEWMFSEIYAGLAAVYDCPYVWFSSVDPHSMVLSLIDEHLNPAYNPNCLSYNVPPFNFFQRVQELFTQVSMELARQFFLLPYEREDFKEVFGPIITRKGRPVPSFDEVRYNASLMLGNSDVSIGKATRLPQSYKPIGGYHIDPEVKPLPEDLKKIIESAKNGVIYFSMGSNLKSKDIPEEIQKSLLKMFGDLKYTVLWKFEEELSDLPKNVHILQWAPQPSILAHPNCKLFITHGGLLSTIEAVHFGVPIIGIPAFADQFVNVDVSVQKGFALRVDFSYDMADYLKSAIQEILMNPKYKEKMVELNRIFHDKPVSPATELVHWVNHVIRTNGAPHLRSPALVVPWYQKIYLDLLAVVLAVIFIIVKVIKKLCCSRKKVTNLKKKN